ncbi:MAG: bifunctional homocysteine S-methyltransferase/methylenetetrahydrofolate reductase [Acidobacteria bacterium]|jgi:homocysteine S-methyltransferase|nr:bifunctional homocysteine S-methyltransferase/methylenetetrahydrofolate reductase [Acidobacteriota bacterium]
MKVEELRRRLSKEVIVGDGGMGSELLQRLPEGSRLDVAAHEHAEQVLDIHLAYIEAGSELIETATFGSSRPRMQRGRVGELTEKTNAAAVKLAREAREISGRDVLVAGSIAPLAGVLDLDEPDGRRTILTAHAEQAAILAGRGADLLVLETFFRVDELAIAVEAARSVTDLPLIGMMTFAHERPPHPYLEQARMIDELAELDLVAAGVNCAPGPMGAIEILRHVKQQRLPLAVSPNAGMPMQREGRILMAPATPSYLAQFTRQAVGLGAAYVGGCCGTGAEHIRAIAEAARDLKPERRTGTAVVMLESTPTPAPVQPSSSLASKLDRGRFVRLVQLDPPKGTNVEAILEAAEAIGAHPDVDAVDINSNPLARLRMDPLFLGQLIQQRAGLEAVPHITPRDASLMGLQSQLLGAWTGGIRNLLAITGDPSQLGDLPGVHDVYHVDIFELVRALSRMAEGFDCAGNRIGDPPGFLIGVAVNPAAEDPMKEADRLRRKVDNGAHFAMSQVCFDWGAWDRFADLFAGNLPVPTLAAVWPLRSFKMALRLHHEVPGILVPDDLLSALEAAGGDAAKVGYERAVQMLRQAPDHAAGAYLIAPFKQPQAILPVIDDTQ